MELKSYWRFHNTSCSLYTRTLKSLVFFTMNNNIFFISFLNLFLQFYYPLYMLSHTSRTDILLNTA